MKIALTSIPKSGTHLLAKVIENIVGEYSTTLKKNIDPNTPYARKAMRCGVVGGHLRIDTIRTAAYLPFFEDRKIFVLIRDPRDICNSMVHYLGTSHRIEHQALYRALDGLDHEDKIRRVADGVRISGGSTKVPPIGEACRGFIEIAGRFPNSIILRYEDFFEEEMMAARLSKFLDIDSEIARLAICNALGANTRTRRVGKRQHWRETFSPALKNYFSENHRETIRYLGFEV